MCLRLFNGRPKHSGSVIFAAAVFVDEMKISHISNLPPVYLKFTPRMQHVYIECFVEIAGDADSSIGDLVAVFLSKQDW
jgi:hypothetical protein